MTDAFQQPLFGSYFVALLLLPLASSCESTKPMASVTADYINIVYPFLQNIEKNITALLGNASCQEKNHTCEENKEIISIHKLACSIPFNKPKRGGISKIKCELKELTGNIEASLGCDCPKNQDHNGSQLNCTHAQHRTLTRKRLCIMHSIVSDLRSCYGRLTEKYS
ncbi:hypothetical protein MATL_G00035980 [Megalops atlanticus]|uniref:Interleukin-7 n=1 Tax=Megalops atlanticus TaxID=7932 RepID=A0A9D3TGI5_MEGAT|nr:hypothetical protein MATL_G00035980 [Megalops atlanticus]